MKNKKFFLMKAILAALAVCFGGGAPIAQAANGDVTVTISNAWDELGTNIGSSNLVINGGCPGGYTNFGFTNNGDGTYTVTRAYLDNPVPGGSIDLSCDNGETMSLTIFGGDGLVVKTESFTYYTGSNNSRSYAFSGGAAFQYNYKITSVAAEGTGDELISSLSSALTVGGVTCVFSGGSYYCPVLSGNCASATAYVVKDGYVAGNYAIAGAGACSSSQIVGSVGNILYGVKITVRNELGTALTGASVGAGDNQMVSCSESSGTGVYYCAVPVAQNGTGVSILKAGYVQYTAPSGIYANRTSNTSAQSAATYSNVQFAHKVTVDSTAASLGATVTAGSANTSCTKSGNSYYCPVIISQDGGTNDIVVAKSGYITVYGSTSDRTDNASPQGVTDLTSTTVMGSDNPNSFGLKVTVSDELGNAVTGASPTFNGAAPTYSVGNVYYWADTSGSRTLSLARDGYVTKTATLTTSATAQNSQTYTGATGMQYGYKITGITSEVLNAALLASATTVSLGDSTGLNACVLSEGAYYCPVLLANSDGTIIAHIAVDGYVEKTNYATGFSPRTAATAQQSGAIGSIQYAYKLNTFNAEATGSVTPSAVSVGNGDGQISCAVSGGAWYCAVPLANSDGTVNANVASDGFVRANHAISGRASSSAPQVTDAVSGILYAYKVTGVADELENALSSVAVSAGDAYGTSCVESGGAWYCAVPLANTSLTIRAEKAGYVTNTGGSFLTDRVEATDQQQTAAVSGVKFAHKVIITREGDGAALSDATVTTNGITCVEDNATGIYYCAVPIESDNAAINVVRTGYETNNGTNTANRTANSDAQEVATISDVLFQLKLIVADELGNPLSIAGLDTITFNDSAPSYYSTNVAYWAIAPASNAILVIQKDGYVNSGTTNTGLTDVSTSASNGQTVITLADNSARTVAVADGNNITGKGLMFAQKVTVTRSGDGAALAGGTVTAAIGSNGSGGTLCSEDGTSGVYYCAVPVANSNTKTRVAAASYRTKEISFVARTAVTSLQVVLTATLDGQHDNASIVPAVSSQTPADNSTNVAITVNPTITFNGPMDASTLNSISVQLRKYSNDVQINAVVLYNSTTNTVTIAPISNLDNNTRYYLWVSGAKDTSGNMVTAYEAKENQEFTTAAAGTGSFGIISTAMTKQAGIADNSYANGWEWVIRMTLPSNQNSFAIKFNDWVSGLNSLSAANNMRYYSEQISEGPGSYGSPILITAANTYPSSVVVLSDADAATPGIQTDIRVQVKIPASTAFGSYSTSYRVNYESAD